MPIPFLADIEKLITEHGSAAILRERIALANDKHAALESKVIDFESQVTNLMGKIVNLESEINILRLDKKELESKINQLTKPIGHIARLEEVKEKILVAIANFEDITEPDLMYRLSMTSITVEFHLEELKAASFVRPVLRVGQQHTPWRLNHEGKKYLLQYGLA